MTQATVSATSAGGINDRVKVVTRGLYDTQKLRIQLELRVKRLVREGLMTDAEAEDFFNVPLQRLKDAEAAMEKMVWREVRHLPIVDGWLIRVKGVGPRLAALLVANIGDIGRFDTISKLWAYAGLHVIDGRAPKRAVGQKANWNAELKTTAWKLGQSFVKIADSPYRKLYDAYKVRITEREVANGNIIWQSDGTKVTPAHHLPRVKPPAKAPAKPEWTLGRINNMALRFIAKRLLSHLWLVWRAMEGLAVREPYVIEKQGHTTKDDPWEFVE